MSPLPPVLLNLKDGKERVRRGRRLSEGRGRKSLGSGDLTTLIYSLRAFVEPSGGTHSGEGVTKEMEGHGVRITCPYLELCAVTGPGRMELSRVPKLPKSSGLWEALMQSKLLFLSLPFLFGPQATETRF